MGGPTWEEMYWKLNDATKKRISNLETEAAALRERLARLVAAAENILFKRKQNATLTDADFEWLDRSLKEVK